MEAYCERRWGSSGWTIHLRQEGSKDGAKFANWKWWPNTLRSHQWVQYGVDRYKISSDELNAILFKALYEDGVNLSDIQNLVVLGEEVFPNCDAEDLKAYLENNQGESKMHREISKGRREFRIQGVPFFVLSCDGTPKSVFSGAQSTTYILAVLDEAANQDS